MASYVPIPLEIQIPLEDIVIATKNFADENMLKRGEIVDVYRGLLLRSSVAIDVVIRRYTPVSNLLRHELESESYSLSRLKHRNTLSFVGVCCENDERMVILEHVVNGSLDKHLGDPILTWPRRLRICIGASLALQYIHNDIERFHCGFHHDIKSSKILLDKEWEAKVFCFGFKVPYSVVFHHTSSYTDPVYTKTGYGTHKSDVYSLGVILLEVVCGKKVSIDDVNHFIAQMGKNYYELVDIIDPNLKKQMHRHSLSIFLETACNCLKETFEQRPDMNQVVERLKEALALQLKHENLVRNFAHLTIPLNHIKLATNDFDNMRLIYSSSDEMVYRAQLDHFNTESVLTTEGESIRELPKKPVLVKRIVNQKYEKINDFFALIDMLSSCTHPNLVTLLGFCDEDSELILVFECAFETTLHDYLGSADKRTNLTWEQRIRICLDIAYGLRYLLNNMDGESSMILQGVHSANVLLDENWTAKIAYLGVSESNYPHSTTIDTNNIGDASIYRGYDHFLDIDPFFKGIKHQMSLRQPKIDMPLSKELNHIYSLGVILFEILTGKLVNVKMLGSIVRQRYFSEGTLKNMVDPNIMEEALEFSYTLNKGPNEDSLDTYCKITHQCLAMDARSKRPTLEVVINSLKKSFHFQVHLECLKIPLRDIQLATENFDEKYLLGKGGYGVVYKAELDIFNIRSSLAIKTNWIDEQPKMCSSVAIKRIFHREDGLGKEGFLVELGVLSKCMHPNIVSLVGFCVEGGEMLLVYEHASNGSLDDFLKTTDKMINLTWTQRVKMCLDIALGLNYLHKTMEDKEIRIIHRDIKSDNILLGKNLEAKIADFGLSKFHHADQQESTINTNHIAGTNVYMDPEYAKTGRLKKASDIYSFGVVLFEIFSGTLAYDLKYTSKDEKGLAPIAQRHFENGTLKEILDPKITDEAHELSSTLRIGPCHHSLNAFSKIAYRCLAKTQAERPTVKEVIRELEEALRFQENRKDTFKMSLDDIRLGVGYFSDENCIIRGGFGRLYRGEVQYEDEHKKAVVKRFSGSGQEHGFLREFEVLFKRKHENIIGLLGYCKEMDERIIVYEHASNGCLSRHLNDASFSWSTRLKVCIDIANGLNFIHGGDGGQYVVIHRDLKSSNILLADDWRAKICGFELSLTYPTHQDLENVAKDVVGSPGYCDPVYWETHNLTKESDIYSFGVILFEILCGRLACPEDFVNSSQFLDRLVKRHFQVARVDEIVFQGIKDQIVLESLSTFRRIAFGCLHEEREERPAANEVVIQLQKALEFQEAYEIWEAKLPINYKQILQLTKSPEIYFTIGKKDIHNILFKGIILKDNNRWFSIGDNGERNEMVSARLFSFQNRWSHKWRSLQESRFPKVAEMLDVSNLNIQIKIRPQLLPSNVKYSVYLIFKFCGPRKSHAKRMYVNLKYKMGSKNLEAYFATLREDEWMMIELYRFSNHKEDTNFEVLLERFSRCYCDSRAIYIEGIEFRAIENVKQKKMEKLEIQEVLKSLRKMKVKKEPMLWYPLSKTKRKVYHVEFAKGVMYDPFNPSDVVPFNSKSSSQSSVEWIYKVPRQSVLRIKWDINESQTASANTECKCYLVFKLSKDCHGLHCPVIVRNQFHRKGKEIVYFRTPSPWNLQDSVCVPKKRADGWMEVVVSKKPLFGKLKLVTYEGTMFGLIIRGIEFRRMDAKIVVTN